MLVSLKIILSTVIRFMLKFKRIRKKSLRNKVNSNVNFKKLWNKLRLKKQKIKEIVILFHKKKAPDLGFFLVNHDF
jgi:hypothetical protein